MLGGVTEAEGADVDATAANRCQAADGEEEERLRKNSGHQAAKGLHARAHQQHRALPVPTEKTLTSDHLRTFPVLRLVAVCAGRKRPEPGRGGVGVVVMATRSISDSDRKNVEKEDERREKEEEGEPPVDGELQR
ncbi:hypothetical protein CRENBAI_022843 [Crenichthys baileyi]|uniref:Uncharacterized protein n=1 Tax=Crenichthys baileyi TaxID=28760 RepID=A0AAV9RPT4_9TELE